MKLLLVAGARPNFMKIAPLMRAIDDYNENNSAQIQRVLVHTGQHYDLKMSEVFFSELGIHSPDVHLDVGSSSHAVQTANVMVRFEQTCLEENVKKKQLTSASSQFIVV